MSALAWIFGLGAAAVVFPLLFHLIRRTPRGLTEFSTLMFLRATPPTLTRRSRLDNLWLLLLRVLAVALIVLAFMRPFFRTSTDLADFDAGHRRVVILLDVSASMRRGGLWEEAQQTVRDALAELEDHDRVALLTFDQEVRRIVDFSNDDSPEGSRLAIQQINEQLASLTPGWGQGDLGRALVSVASQLDDWQDQARSDQEGRRPKLQIIVVSDMQASAATSALQAFQWPDLVKVDLRAVVAPRQDNATLEVLPGGTEEAGDSLRVRVTHHGDGPADTFQVRWPAESPQSSRDMTYLVPGGTSRTLPVLLEDLQGVASFELAGDGESFDNRFYLVPPQRVQRQVLFVGPGNTDDPQSLEFYFERALSETPTRSYQLRHRRAGELAADDWRDIDLAVIAEDLPEPLAETLESQLASGRTALVVLPLQPQAEMPDRWQRLLAIRTFTPAPPPVDAPDRKSYRMWGEIDFTHPLFRPFASPGFSDFTKIRFWRQPQVELEEAATVIVRFDSGQPAFWQRQWGERGRLLVLASGWTPEQSQLGLSTKFVPLLNSLVELAVAAPQLDQVLTVGQPLAFPALDVPATVIKPHGGRQDLEVGSTQFRQTQLPGLYQLQPGSGSRWSSPLTYAVNVDRRESQTDVMPVDQLEQLGVQLGVQESAATELAQLRELRDRELEDRQSFWKWLLVAAILILLVETYYAGAKSGVAGTAPGLQAEVS